MQILRPPIRSRVDLQRSLRIQDMRRFARHLFIDKQESNPSTEAQAPIMMPPNADTRIAESHREVISNTSSPGELIDLLSNLGGQT
jgi:hypothetical protein